MVIWNFISTVMQIVEFFCLLFEYSVRALSFFFSEMKWVTAQYMSPMI